VGQCMNNSGSVSLVPGANASVEGEKSDMREGWGVLLVANGQHKLRGYSGELEGTELGK